MKRVAQALICVMAVAFSASCSQRAVATREVPREIEDRLVDLRIIEYGDRHCPFMEMKPDDYERLLRGAIAAGEKDGLTEEKLRRLIGSKRVGIRAKQRYTSFPTLLFGLGDPNGTAPSPDGGTVEAHVGYMKEACDGMRREIAQGESVVGRALIQKPLPANCLESGQRWSTRGATYSDRPATKTQVSMVCK